MNIRNDADRLLGKTSSSDGGALISKCITAVEKRSYHEISKVDFEKALDDLALNHRREQASLGRPITAGTAYREALLSEQGKKLYKGLDDLMTYNGPPPWERE